MALESWRETLLAGLIIALLGWLLILASEARAQTPADIISMPDTASATWRAQLPATGVPVSSVGWVDCGSTPGSLADLNDVVTLPSPAVGLIVSGMLTFQLSDGDQCARFYSVSSTGVLSDPSPNARIVLLKPMPVVVIE